MGGIPPSALEVTRYPLHLFQTRHLAEATLGVHQAAITSFPDPLGNSLSDSMLLIDEGSLFRKAARVGYPPGSFGMCLVLYLLYSWENMNELSFPQLSWRTFSLILIFSCHRISNLSLLGVDAPFLSLNEVSVLLQVGFGRR